MELKKITNEEIDNYIMTIVNDFGGRVLISPLLVAYDKFIQPKTPCMASVAQAHAFVVDCVGEYKKFLQYYRDCDFGEAILDKIQVVDNFVNNYFGYMKNDELRRKINGENPDLHSIQKYRFKNCAMCFERAILSHNLLQLLGLKSILITKNHHTYNLIQYSNSIYLYDPTNPSVGQIKGQMIRFPSVKIIRGENLKNYLYGNESIKINPGFYEFMFGATNVRVPNMEYIGLGLKDPNSTNERGI